MTIELNSELFDLLNSNNPFGPRSPIFGAQGLKSSELGMIEEQLGFDLPNDMKFLLENLDDSNNLNFSWKNFDIKMYEKSIERIISGIEFDIENNGTWLSRWGDRPMNMAEAKSIVREDFKLWPRLVPVFGHRYLAVDPCLSNNPIFSVMQTDIICYGANLGAYLCNEFLEQSEKTEDWTPQKVIPVWHDFAYQTEGFLVD
jgi:hypothetical protein